jgi:hypothetical protein
LSGGTASLASPSRPLATAAYFLAVLVVLDSSIGFVLGAWPPNPSLLPWRHISSGLLIVAAPMIGAAAVGILLAAKVRGDARVLELLRLCGLIALVLCVPFAVLYTVDSTKIYDALPAPQTRSFVVLEMRMFTLMAIVLALLLTFIRAAWGGSAVGATPEPPAGRARSG